jgi:hypothetical protein
MYGRRWLMCIGAGVMRNLIQQWVLQEDTMITKLTPCVKTVPNANMMISSSNIAHIKFFKVPRIDCFQAAHTRPNFCGRSPESAGPFGETNRAMAPARVPTEHLVKKTLWKAHGRSPQDTSGGHPGRNRDETQHPGSNHGKPARKRIQVAHPGTGMFLVSRVIF